MLSYEDFKDEVIRVSYAGEVRKMLYVPRLDVEYNIDYVRKLIFADHFDERIQSASFDTGQKYQLLSRPDNFIEFINSDDFNASQWQYLKLFFSSDFQFLRLLIENVDSSFCIRLVQSYSVLNNRLICCDPSEPAVGFGSLASAGNGAFVK